jgi:uncharacterized protein
VRVAELWRYPVKSLRGERLERAEILRDGIAGDRLTRVLGPRGAKLTARTNKGLLRLQGAVGPDGEPLVDGERWDSDAALAAIRGATREGAWLAPLGRHFDAMPIHVTTDGAVAALDEDRRRFRSNLAIEGVDGLAERDWVGRRLRVGNAKLLVRERCERCLVTTIDPDTLEVRPEVLRRINSGFERSIGVYCEVAVPGEVAVGDPVELVP